MPVVSAPVFAVYPVVMAGRVQDFSWRQASSAPLVLLSGPEDLFAERSERAIRVEQPRAGFERVYADVYESGMLADLASPNLFADPSIISAWNVEKCNTAFLEDAKRYVLSPAADVTFIVRHRSGVRGKALLDGLNKSPHAKVFSCPEVSKERDRVDFVRAEAASLGMTISAGAVRMLVQAYTGLLAELASAVEQLRCDVGDRVQENDVFQLTDGRVETSGFKIADAALAGNVSLALQLLRHARMTGINYMPLYSALAIRVRQLASVYGLSGNKFELAKRLQMQPWQVEQASRSLRGWREHTLGEAVIRAATTSRMLRGGASDPDYALENFLLFIASKGKHG